MKLLSYILLVILILCICYQFNLIHKFLVILLTPFGTKPETVFKKTGVVGTVLVSALVKNPEELYSYIGDQPGLDGYLNMGWWDQSDIKKFDHAQDFNMRNRCDELVRKLAEKAEIQKKDHILDVGFGFGEQDVLLSQEYEFRSLTGINITLPQIREAHQKARDHSLDNLTFLKGDAVKLPFEKNSFHKIIALESPFHFRTREDFFEEAQRVLKPDGILVTADIINKYDSWEGPLRHQIFETIHNLYWQVPAENHTTIPNYQKTLKRHNFISVEIEDVTENVIIPGITNYIRWRSRKLNPLLRLILNPLLIWGIDFYRSGFLKYILTKTKL